MRRLQDLTRAVRLAFRQQARTASSAAANAPATAEVAVASGVPDLSAGRKVIISAPAKTAGQHGNLLTAEGGAPVWRIELENTNSKWINGLMGWTSTSDPWENVNRSLLTFQTKEAAVAFAEKKGWQVEVAEPNYRAKQRPRRYPGYGDNFSTKRKGLPVGGLKSEHQGKRK